jgi:hypothetical protein
MGLTILSALSAFEQRLNPSDIMLRRDIGSRQTGNAEERRESRDPLALPDNLYAQRHE